MGIFSRILDKLRHGPGSPPSRCTARSGFRTATSQPSAQTGQQGASGGSLQNVDIDAVLSQMAEKGAEAIIASRSWTS